MRRSLGLLPRTLAKLSASCSGGRRDPRRGERWQDGGSRGYLANAEVRGPRSAGGALVRFAPLPCDFTRWSYDPGPADSDRFVVEVENAGEFPDVLRFIAQGCIQYLAERVNERPVRLTSERPSPDRIAYTKQRWSAG